jgi:hypothetical protein
MTTSRGNTRIEALKRLQLRFKLDPPLNWRSHEAARRDLIQRMDQNDEFGLDVLDYMLHHMAEFTGEYEQPVDVAERLASVVAVGGSAWEVAITDEPHRSSWHGDR